MKIAIVAPLDERIPPVGYGGTELIVSELTEGLVKKGHEVTLFASGDSKTAAHLVSGCNKALRLDNYSLNPVAAHLLMMDKVVLASSQFDLIHSHLGWRFLPFVKYCKAPVLNTYHAPYNHPRVKFIFEAYKNLNFTALSLNHKKGIDLHFLKVIYNAIDIPRFSFDFTTQKDPLIYMSRFDVAKGTDVALRVALELKKKIIVAGKVENELPEGLKYYKEKVEPYLKDPLVDLVGELGFEGKTEHFKRARAFLFPVNWEEPFGLVVVESMAYGTPVVAFARGAIPELMKDGETGFVVNQSENDIRGDWVIKKTGFEGLREAVERIYSMPAEEYGRMRSACRAWVEGNFTVEKMTGGYEEVYKKILGFSS